MIEMERLVSLAAKWDGYARERRRYLHRHPELSGQELETSKYLKAEAERFGLTVESLSGTGFIAVLDTGRPGKTLALRVDIDALPLTEAKENLKGPKGCISANPGVCHACGHDAHMAIALTAMAILSECKEALCGRILFAFEEGEERGSGIRPMIEALKEKGTDAVYGNHVTSFMESGTVCLDEGPRMAGALGLRFALKGKSGHGSRPDLACNPITAGSAIVTQLSALWASKLDVTKTVTLGITQFQSGISYNIIPETAEIGGTCRFFDLEEAKKADRLIHETVDTMANLYGCSVEYHPMAQIICSPVVNDPALARLARQGSSQLLPTENIKSGVTWFASESFSRYRACFPSMFAFIGIRNPQVGSGAEHHNPEFDVDDGALKTGVLLMCKFAADFLE